MYGGEITAIEPLPLESTALKKLTFYLFFLFKLCITLKMQIFHKILYFFCVSTTLQRSVDVPEKQQIKLPYLALKTVKPVLYHRY